MQSFAPECAALELEAEFPIRRMVNEYLPARQPQSIRGQYAIGTSTPLFHLDS